MAGCTPTVAPPATAFTILRATMHAHPRLLGFRIVMPDEAAAMFASGAFAGSDLDVRDGYIHCSALGEVRPTAERYFASASEVVVLAVVLAPLGDVVRWERVESRGTDFPHLYGPLPADAVAHAWHVRRGDDGFVWPALFTADGDATAAPTPATATATGDAGDDDGCSAVLRRVLEAHPQLLVLCTLTPAQHAGFAATGAYAGSDLDAADGFIHCSPASKLATVADKYFTGAEVYIAVMVASALGPAVRWEDVPSLAAAFPHVYGTELSSGQVAGVVHTPVGADGSRSWPSWFPSSASAAPAAGAGQSSSASATSGAVEFDIDADGVPRDVRVYRSKAYWDFRFRTEDAYDWLGDVKALEAVPELVAAIGSGRALVLGCGTSALAKDLVDAGVSPAQLVSTDFSSVAIDKMLAKCGDSVGEFKLADMTDLAATFAEPHQFTAVIDKCSIDALTVDPGDVWDPDEKTRRDVTAVLRGVHHVLTPDGVFLSYTFNQEHFRRPLLEAEGLFDVRVARHVELGFKEVFVFELRKKK